MTTLPTINRRTWLALWAQKRRRARHALPAPVVSAVYPGTLAWVWNRPDPYRWRILVSWDGGASWNWNTEYWTAGAARSFVPDGGSSFHLVVGVDAAGNEITRRSNSVRPDDAPAPPTLLTGLFGHWKLDEDWALDAREDSTANGNYLQVIDPFGNYSDEEGMETGPVRVDYSPGILGNGCIFGEYGFCLSTNGPANLFAGDFSIQYWVYPIYGSYDHQIGVQVGQTIDVYHTDYAQITARLWTSGSTHATVQGNGVPNSWNHVVITASASQVKLYINGLLASTIARPAFFHADVGWMGDDQIAVGCGAWGYPSASCIDEVGLWQRALDANDVSDLYNSGSALAYGNF